MKYCEDRVAIEMSVKDLCDRAMPSGDLGSYSRQCVLTSSERGVLLEHLQAEAGTYYAPDVALSYTASLRGLYYTVEGSADGVMRQGDDLVVDVVRSVRRYAFYEPPSAQALATLKCLCFFLAVREDRAEIGGRLT